MNKATHSALASPWSLSTGCTCAAMQALIQLLDPPFDKSELNPGYIKGYPPGGGKTVASTHTPRFWAIMAFAELGDSRRAWELLSV